MAPEVKYYENDLVSNQEMASWKPGSEKMASFCKTLERAWVSNMEEPIQDFMPSQIAPEAFKKMRETQAMMMPVASRFMANLKNGNGDIIRNDDWDSFLQGFYLLRVQWLEAMIDPRRNLDAECGYPPIIVPKQYRYMYDREGVATRVVNIYPDECWAVDPVVYEKEDHKLETPFELSWEQLQMSSENDPLHYMYRTDVQSGIGRYALLLLGTSDGMDLSIPLPGIDERGQPTADAGKGKFQLLFMRPFDEIMAHIINYERDPSNPRFGRPVYYHVIFADIRVGEPGMTAAAISVTSRVVHWTRVIHIADNRESSEVFGVPRMQPVFNRLCDVRKILGGSAEMFWKGGFPGYSFELSPDLTTAGVTLDMKAFDEQLQRFSNGLQRYMATVGLQAKSLAPQVANPDPSLMAQLNAIGLAIGAPLRIFMGSEQAQLASGQDVRTWNRRLMKRQSRYLTPMIIRPFINRLITLGILAPVAGKNPYGYKVWWPDINVPSDDEKSKIADKNASALMKYVMGGGYQVIPPFEFLTQIMALPADVVKVIIEAAKKWATTPDFEVTPPNKGAGDGEDQSDGDSGGKSSSK